MPTVTVLMTTYHGTTVDDIRRSVGSIRSQTRPPEEFLIVVDGPVSREVDAVLQTLAAEDPPVRVERLPHNVGSGPASARGLALAKGDVVARQDSDDISLPHRLERQLAVLEGHELDIVGSTMLEFVDDPANVVAVRGAPLSHRDILAGVKINNPFNNPSIMFRRRLAVEVGGYEDVPYHEDYDLVARMVAAGARTENLAEPLVLFHVGGGMMSRRAGLGMLRHEWTMQQRLRNAGLIGNVRLVSNMVVRSTFRLLPASLLRRAYSVLFHDRSLMDQYAHLAAPSGSDPEKPSA